MVCTVSWFSSFGSDFNYDFGVSTDEGERFGLSVLPRTGDSVYRTYFTSGRGLDRLRIDFNLLGPTLTPRPFAPVWPTLPSLDTGEGFRLRSSQPPRLSSTTLMGICAHDDCSGPLFIWFVRESSARASEGNSSVESRPEATRAPAVPPVMIRSSTPITLKATGVDSDVAENSPAAATWRHWCSSGPANSTAGTPRTTSWEARKIGTSASVDVLVSRA